MCAGAGWLSRMLCCTHRMTSSTAARPAGGSTGTARMPQTSAPAWRGFCRGLGRPDLNGHSVGRLRSFGCPDLGHAARLKVRPRPCWLKRGSLSVRQGNGDKRMKKKHSLHSLVRFLVGKLWRWHRPAIERRRVKTLQCLSAPPVPPTYDMVIARVGRVTSEFS